MGKWSKYAKRTLCMLLSAAMVMTDAEISVFAAENTASAEMVDENLTEGTGEGKTAESADREAQEAKTAETENPESRTTGIETESADESEVKEAAKNESQESKDSVSSETKSTEEHTTQGTESEREESTIEERTEEKTSAEESKTETASSAEIVTETAEVEDTRTEEASSVESTVEETQIEENTLAETTAEDIQTEETVTGETEVQETETQEALAEDVIAQGTYKEDGNDITWVIDPDGKLTVTGTGDFSGLNFDDEDYYRRAPWYDRAWEIKTAEIHVQGMTNAAGMFSECTNLISVDLSDLDTSNVTSMRGMFNDCSSLRELDLKGFVTVNVCDMAGMFDRCGSLTDLDLSSFRTDNVVNMGGMFFNCDNIINLDLSNFNTENVTDMGAMFYNCRSLKSVNLSSFKSDSLKDDLSASDMFSGCDALTQIYTPDNLLVAIALPGKVWKDSEGRIHTQLPMGVESILLTKQQFIAQGECKENGNDITWVIDKDGKLTVKGIGDYVSPDTAGENVAPWSEFSKYIKTAEINVQGIQDTSNLLRGCVNLVEVDLTKLDTSNVTRMSHMFYSNSLTSLDVSNFDTSNVTDMTGMFCYSNLTSLDVSNFDTSNVTDMSRMFYGCENLTSLDLSSFDTSNVTDMTDMFYGCESLTLIKSPKNVTTISKLPEGIWYDSEGNIYTELPKGMESILLKRPEVIRQGTYQENGNDITWVIDLNGKLTVTGTGDFSGLSFDDEDYSSRAPWSYSEEIKTAEIHVKGMKNADYMFWECSNLTSIDLSDFDTSQIVSMREMFSWCSSLEYLDLSAFDTGNVEDMASMFRSCSSLKSLDLSSFDTANVQNMRNMFRDCSSLEFLNLSSFDVHNAYQATEYYSGMTDFITGCIALREIRTPFNIPESESPQLPLGITFKGPDGSIYTELPKRKDSITLTREDMEGVIAHGEYKEDGNNVTWVIDTDGKLTVEGRGDYAPSSQSLSSARAPWYEFRDYIETAEINVQEMTDATDMFSGCANLYKVNLSNLDTSNVTNMSFMFSGCENLIGLDLSNFDTRNVTDMRGMFSGLNLDSLDLSSFDTCNVTNMQGMFSFGNWISLDLSSFDTRNVKNMASMFWGSYLVNLDLSSFDTHNVTNMGSMFLSCGRLSSLDLSNFDICNGTYTEYMFTDCAFQKLYTPKNVAVVVDLDGTWYDIMGNEYTELPQGRSDSILLTYNKRPTECITAAKKKTSYRQWEKFDISDLTVKYNDSEGDIITLSASDYTTNADQIDTSILGTQVLTVTYNGLTAEINVKITERIRTTVNFTGIDTKDYTYSKKPVTPTVLARTDKGADVTREIKDILIYTYAGKQADGTEYPASNEAPTNAGEYTLTAAIPEDNQDYTGSSQTFEFSIKKAQVTITASDISLTTGAALPKPEDYKYTISSPAAEDDLEKKPTLTCSITDTSKEGTYDIVIADAALKSNPNYETEIKYVNGKVEVTAYYTVTFDLSGKGESTTQKDIKKGSTISQPADPQAEGFTFTGWYKDKEYTAKWDFSVDKIESDMTLYAGWKAKEDDDDDKDDNKDDSSEDKDDSAYTSEERKTLTSVSAEIAAIKSRVYDGTAYRPGVRVTAVVDGRKVTLTEGTDYRVLYKNNINAGQATVTVKGNGIYKGECSKNFTITAKPINKLKIVTGGVASGSSIQNLPVYVYDGAMLLKSGTDYTLLGYSARNSTASVTVTGKGNYTGTTTAKLTVYSVSSDKIINPENVTLNVQSVPYTGKSIKDVEPTVKIGSTTLSKNKDYKVQYQNNKNAGTAFVIVTGKGAYKGKAVVPFTIKAVNTGSMNIKPLSAKTYNGKLQKPAVTVTVNSKKLSKDKDYTVTYKDNLHAGTATVIVTGKGNYAGMKGEAKFTINPQKISKASIKGTQGNLTLTYSKRTLKEGADYEKPVYGTASKNKIKVTIKGKKDFTGEATKSVKIL